MIGCVFRVRFFAGILLGSLALAACGGGGGSPAVDPTVAPTATPTIIPGTTNASGTVVSDSTGSALAGESVSLEPWVGGATPLPSPVATTNPQGGFTLSNVPNGHYILVIGSNSISDTSFATVHDNVTLAGGNQTLQAPTLPTIPTITAPAWETNGEYRIAAIDATLQAPCLTAFNADRVTATLSQAVEDEWLLENERAIDDYMNSGNGQIVGYQFQTLVTPGFNVGGGTTLCAAVLSTGVFVAGNPYGAEDAGIVWVGGQYAPYASVSGGSYGSMSFANDPRTTTDPKGVWP